MESASHWVGWKPATCLETHCFCEKPQVDYLIKQPWNSWSSLLFVLFAFIIFFNKKKSHSGNLLQKNISWRWIYACGMVLTGLGSFFFHASLTFCGQWFDVVGMYTVILFFVWYNCQRLFNLKDGLMIPGYLFLVSFFSVVIYFFPHSRRYLFGSMIFIFLISALVAHVKIKAVMDSRWLLGSAFTFFAGFAFWWLDNDHTICWENVIPFGHVLWHFLTAVSAWMIYRYYLSESKREMA